MNYDLFNGTYRVRVWMGDVVVGERIAQFVDGRNVNRIRCQPVRAGLIDKVTIGRCTEMRAAIETYDGFIPQFEAGAIVVAIRPVIGESIAEFDPGGLSR